MWEGREAQLAASKMLWPRIQHFDVGQPGGLAAEAESLAVIRTCRQIFDRLSVSHAARPAFERLQFRKTANSRRNTRELHGLTASRAARRIRDSIHDKSRHPGKLYFILAISPILLMFERLEKSDNIRRLTCIESKLRHVCVTGPDSFN